MIVTYLAVSVLYIVTLLSIHDCHLSVSKGGGGGGGGGPSVCERDYIRRHGKRGDRP